MVVAIAGGLALLSCLALLTWILFCRKDNSEHPNKYSDQGRRGPSNTVDFGHQSHLSHEMDSLGRHSALPVVKRGNNLEIEINDYDGAGSIISYQQGNGMDLEKHYEAAKKKYKPYFGSFDKGGKIPQKS